MAKLEDMLNEWASNSPYSKEDFIEETPREDQNVGSVKISAGSNGSRLITGEGPKPEAKIKASIPLEPTTITNSNVNLDSSRELFTNLDKQLEVIKGGDSKAGAQALAEAKGSIAATQARFYKEAQNTAMAEFGVPQLLKELQINEQQDRMDPDYMKYQEDSSITAGIRARVMQSKAAADGSIAERLKGNETYQQLSAKAETLAAVGAAYLNRRNSREAVAEQEADNVMDSLGVEGQRRAAILFPQESKNPLVLTGYIKNKTNGRELEMVLKAPAQEIPNLALKGSSVARELLKRDEASKVGPQAQILLEEGYKIADDPLKAKEALKYLNDNGFTRGWSESDKQRALSATSDIGIKGSKEEKELMQEERARIAKAVMTVKHQALFDSDMLKLPSDRALPEFLVLAQKDPAINTNGKISKADAIALASRADDVNVRMQNINELVDFYSSAADKVSKSSLFNINPLSVEKLKSEAAVSRLASFFKPLGWIGHGIATVGNVAGATVDATFETPVEYLGADDKPSVSEALRRAVLKTTGRDPNAAGFPTIRKAFINAGEQ